MPLIEGITYAHEHTTIDLSSLKGTDDTNLDCYKETIREYKKLYELGVRNIIDVTVMGMKRNPSYVQSVADESGMNIIQSTGWYQDKFHPAYIKEKTVNELAEIMISELTIGILDTEIKAELIGEIGTSKNMMTPNEQKVFQAAVIAQKELEVPITTHTTLGTYGKEQVEFFINQRADLEKIVIGHVDLTGDSEYIVNLLKEGVYVELDTIGKENYMPDAKRLEILKRIKDEGFEDKVFLSMDITRKSQLKYKGGLGYSYLLETFVPYLLSNGISQDYVDKLLIHNPLNFYNKEVLI